MAGKEQHGITNRHSGLKYTEWTHKGGQRGRRQQETGADDQTITSDKGGKKGGHMTGNTIGEITW